MTATEIEWTDVVWNPTTGCDRVSPGCDNCYALTMAKRLKGMGQAKYQTDGDPRTSGPGFGIAEHPDALDLPIRWKKPRKVFVNSMSDLFHQGVSARFIAEVFGVMAAAPRHTFQVLTKRHARMRSILSEPSFAGAVRDCAEMYRAGGWADVPWPLPNVHLGVSAENQQRADIRIPALLATPAAVRWVSLEPMLGPIDLLGDVERPGPAITRTGVSYRTDYGTGIEHDCDDQVGLDWAVVGGESGANARPMHPEWALSLRDQCAIARIPFLFKQWGEWAPAQWKGEGGATHAFTGGFYREAGLDVEGFMELGHSPTSLERDDTTPTGAQGMRRVGKKAAGRTLDGCIHDAYPAGA